MVAWDDHLEADPVPPGHGEPVYLAGVSGRGSNLQDEWTPDPRPIPPTTEDIEF